MQASVYCVPLRKQELPGMYIICSESQVTTSEHGGVVDFY